MSDRQLTLDTLTQDTHTAFRRALATIPEGRLFTVEDVRDVLDAADIPDKARGVLFNAACRAGLLEPATVRIGDRRYYLSATSSGQSARGAKVMAYRRCKA